MCSSCEKLSALILLEAVEEDLLAADVEDRLAPAGAVRPLFEHERRAQTRFADLDETLDAAVLEAAAELAALHALIGATLMSELYGGDELLTPAELMARMESLIANQPAAVRQATAEVTARLQEVLAASYATASAQLLDEAERQGVQPAIQPRAVDVDVYQAAAAAVAAHPWRRITGKIMDELGKPAVVVSESVAVDAVQKVLDSIKVDGSADLARQAINTASGMGRLETAEQMEPAEIWASEIMDRNTCTPCSHIDGKDYDSLADARADYPVGGYKNCDGESRCRGTLVFVFPDPQ